MAFHSTPTGATDASSSFGLLMKVVGSLHDPSAPFDPRSAHDLAQLSTNRSVLQGLQQQFQVNASTTSRHLIDAACDPEAVPSEVRDFWVTYLDEARSYDSRDWWKNWSHGLRTWKALYAAFLCPVGHKYAVLLGVMSKRLIHIAASQETDVMRRRAMNEFYQPIRDAMTQSLKDTSTKLSTRRDALFGLSITLFRIFFHLQTHQLSAQIVQLIRPHIAKLGATYLYEGQQHRMYSKADEVEFRFLLGVYYLGQRRIFEAHKEFERSFELCSHRVSFRNRRLILIRLTTTSLLLGTLPATSLLDAFGLREMFEPLAHGIRHGDLATYRQALGVGSGPDALARAEHFRKFKVLGILREKGEVLVWRSLLRKTLLLHRKNNNITSDRATLPVSQFLAALQFVTRDPSYDLQDAECICVSLLDQGFLRAYIVHSSQMLVFSKEADMGFPPIAKVRMR